MPNQQQFEEPEQTNLYAPQTAWKEEAWATWEAQMAQRSEAAQFEATLATAAKEAQAYRKMQKSGVVTRTAFMGLFGVMTLYGVSQLIRGNFSEAANFLVYTSLISCFSGVAMSKSHKEAAEKLTQFDDVRAAGFLADALESNDAHLVIAARNALIRLLPRLQFSDAALLSAEQRNILTRVLPSAVTRESRALSLAILKAYEQVGSEKEAAAVENLAKSSVAAYDTELREAAQECLPHLRASVARRKESSVLLRASQAQEVRPETLLRPAAYAASANDAQELLRSSQDKP